mmetsp:Transcript_4314/g.8992  ORF Transcript_4314/g.8992 Transcript_4314/m.8992 type:complete len:187 (-) Transcript_4314:303-863(-)
MTTTTSFFRSMLFLGLTAVVLLAQMGDAFVQPIPSVSSSKATILPKVAHLPVNNFFSDSHSTSSMLMATDPEAEKSSLPFWLDPGTRGGAVFWSLVLFIVPLVGYSVVTNFFGVDGVEAGKYIGVGFTAFATLAWVFTYIFRVATKDMTYAKQLKDYENAVIAKRLEELDEDEIQALVEEIERDDF